MSAATKPALRWVAFRDGIGHAQPALSPTRALCGAAMQPLRYAWPERTRCATCSALAVV